MVSDIRFNSSAIRAYECVSEAQGLVSTKYWLFLGISIVGMIIGGCVPCVSIFLAGPIAVGIFYTYFTEMRGQPIEFGMMFKGFERFVPAMAVGIVQAIPEIIANIFRFGVQISDVGRSINRGGGSGRGSQFFLGGDFAMQSAPDFAMSGAIIAIIVAVVIGFIIFGFAWRVTFFFALPLIAEYDLSPMEAIKLSARAGWSNVGGIFVLGIFQFLVSLVGVLLLCIGIFFVLPIIQGMNAIAFRQVFPDQREFFNQEPPTPNIYGGTYGNAQ